MLKRQLICCLLALGLGTLLHGQNITIANTSTASQWTVNTILAPPLNEDPPTWADATAGPFIAVSGCTSQSNSIGTSATCNQAASTNFYRLDFATPACLGQIQLTVRCDDAFRVLINGSQLPGTLSLNNCSGDTLTELNGNTVGTTYTFTNFTNLINPFIGGNNTMIIEVINCTGPSYLNASLTYTRRVLPAVNATIGYQVKGSTSEVPYLALWGNSPKSMKNLGYSSDVWMGNWEISTGSSSVGPWTVVQTHQENTSTSSNPWYTQNIPYGTYVRVTYTITNSCNNNTATTRIIIYLACPGCRPAEISTSSELLTYTNAPDDRSSNDDGQFVVSQLVESDTLDTRASSLNPASDLINYVFEDTYAGSIQVEMNIESNDIDIQLLDCQGKVVATQRATNQTHIQIETRHLPAGLYVIHAKSPSLGKSQSIKVPLSGNWR